MGSFQSFGPTECEWRLQCPRHQKPRKSTRVCKKGFRAEDCICMFMYTYMWMHVHSYLCIPIYVYIQVSIFTDWQHHQTAPDPSASSLHALGRTSEWGHTLSKPAHISGLEGLGAVGASAQMLGCGFHKDPPLPHGHVDPAMMDHRGHSSVCLSPCLVVMHRISSADVRFSCALPIFVVLQDPSLVVTCGQPFVDGAHPKKEASTSVSIFVFVSIATRTSYKAFS